MKNWKLGKVLVYTMKKLDLNYLFEWYRCMKIIRYKFESFDYFLAIKYI